MNRPRPFARFAADRRANMATLTALSAPIALMFAAFAVDEANLIRQNTAPLADVASGYRLQ